MKNHAVPAFGLFLKALKLTDQRKVLVSLLKHLSARYLNSIVDEDLSPNSVISAVVKLISDIVDKDPRRVEYLTTWLTDTTGAGVGDGIAIRRAVIAAISWSRETIGRVLEKLIGSMEKMYISYTPVLQQEGM